MVTAAAALGHADGRDQLAFTVEDLLAFPLGLPARIVDLGAEAWGLAVLEVGDADDGVAVTLHREEAAHQAPQALATDGQDDLVRVVGVADEIDGGVGLDAGEAGRVALAGEGARGRRIAARLEAVVGLRVMLVGVLAGLEV